MSSVQISGNASGTGVLTIAAPNTNTSYTQTLPSASGNVVVDSATQTLTNKTWSSPASSTISSGTSQASTSGTSITFTGIPSWVKRVTVSISAVSTSGTATLRFRIGPVAGVETSGYLGTSTGFATSTLASIQFTAGFDLNDGGTAAASRNGAFVFTLLDSATNTWAMQGCQGQSNANNACFIGGSKPLAGPLSVLSMTTTNGTDTFDAGIVNILYE